MREREREKERERENEREVKSTTGLVNLVINFYQCQCRHNRERKKRKEYKKGERIIVHTHRQSPFKHWHSNFGR